MTRKEAKELLPIIQAFAEGKTIQYEASDGWIDLDALYPHSDILSKYRIKPEIKCRPFKTQEECWNEMLKHQPFGWVKSPRGELFCIDKVFEEGIVYKHSSCHFNEYLEGQYSFVDGTPFGIKEESMVVKHNKTGNLYYLGSEKCKAKINGEWVDAVLYRGWEKKTGEYCYFVREKSDFESHFTVLGDIRTGRDLTTMQKQLSVLKEVAEEYPGKTIGNVIVQLEARLKELN